MTDLLSCPFCGEKPKLNEHRDARGLWQSVACEDPDCGVGETYGRLNGASIKQWNRRAALEARAHEGWDWLKSAEPTVSKTGSDVVLSFASGTDAAQALGIICDAIASPSARDVVPTDRTEIELLREYREATEHWQLQPMDAKERTAHLIRLGLARPAPDAAPAQEGMVELNGRTEIELLREYRTATEYWQLQPMDAKERTEHFKRFDLLAALPSAPTPGMGERARKFLALADKATPGEWTADDGVVFRPAGENSRIECNGPGNNYDDAAFIVAARTEAVEIIRALTGDGARRASPAEPKAGEP